MGYHGIDEPARRILSEQRRIDGDGIPSRNTMLFVELMLSRAIEDYCRLDISSAPVFFDRGIPDTVAYASLFGLEVSLSREAARNHRYNRQVFYLPSWEQIYTTDDERTMTFQAAREFGEGIRETYESLDYSLVDVPFLPEKERVEFILTFL